MGTGDDRQTGLQIRHRSYRYKSAVRQQFRQFKKEDISRKAKKSRSMRGKVERKTDRKRDKRNVEEQKELFRLLVRIYGRKGAKMFMEELNAREADDHET